MLTKFIQDDLSKRNRRISGRKFFDVPYVLPIDFINAQKPIVDKITAECESILNFIKGFDLK